MAFLAVENVVMRYGQVTALKGVDLTVEEGEFVTLLGPSGSGKTTLLMAIAGFNVPNSGRILLEGRDITRLEPEERDFGFVFQGYALFPHLTVAENIAFPLRVRRWDKARIAARVDEMLALVELGPFARRKPRELSGGQQQRVALARALSFGPRVLLLDEPLSALDRMLREGMQQELRRLHRETGVTFLFVTHDQQEAITMSDRVAVFEAGNIVEAGTPQGLYRRPATRFVAGFLGENNFVPARVSQTRVEALGQSFDLPPERIPPGLDGAATLWLRPGDIEPGPGGAEDVTFTAQVLDHAFAGSTDSLYLRLASGDRLHAALATAPDDPDALVGTEQPFHVRKDALGLVAATED